jgi:hypothetical protein
VQRTIQMQNARFEQNANVLPIIIKTIELLWMTNDIIVALQAALTHSCTLLKFKKQ